jgi:hypothetical protein
MSIFITNWKSTTHNWTAVTFRFNRRTSTSRGKLFYRLAQQAVQTPPTTYDNLGDHNL